MWDLAIFIGGMAVGVAVTYGLLHPERAEFERLKTQDRILAETVADNFIELEGLRSEVEDIKTELRAEMQDLKDWVTGELIRIEAGK